MEVLKILYMIFMILFSIFLISWGISFTYAKEGSKVPMYLAGTGVMFSALALIVSIIDFFI